MLSCNVMHAVQLGLAQAHQRDMAFLSALGDSFAPGELFMIVHHPTRMLDIACRCVLQLPPGAAGPCAPECFCVCRYMAFCCTTWNGIAL